MPRKPNLGVKVAQQIIKPSRPRPKPSVKRGNAALETKPTSLPPGFKKRWITGDAPFPIGQKPVFLPNFQVVLQYNPFVPPTHAQFHVPLTFNKLDLRDYLWHAYKVRVKSIRSQVVQQPIQRVVDGTIRDIPGKKRKFRPRARKRMIVKLEKPFVWPSVEKLKEQDGSRYFTDARKSVTDAESRNQIAKMAGTNDSLSDGGYWEKIKALEKQANDLLSGRIRWKNKDSLAQTSRTVTPGAFPGPTSSPMDSAASTSKTGDGAAERPGRGKTRSRIVQRQMELKRRIQETRARQADSGLQPLRSSPRTNASEEASRRRNANTA